MNEKETLRTLIKEKIQSIEPKQMELITEKILEKLWNHQAWKKANTVGITISRKNEINTYPIIEKGWKEGKKIVVPKTNKRTKEMSFYELTSFSQLEKTYADLLEPIPEQCLVKEKDQIDFLIVPGLVFDHSGYRLGFGGGFYDRYLNGFQGVTCALAYEEQIVEVIPRESFDIPVDSVITNKKVYYR